MPRLPSRWIAASPLLAVAVAALVALDLLATRRELLGLLHEQADSLGHTLAAAARSNRAAARVAEAQLAARMLDQARFLRELDRAGALRPDALPAVGTDGPLLRINVLGPDGTREHGSGPGHGPGRGRGWGGGALASRLLSGETEAVTDAHAGRAGERLAAGVRRAGGGAIIVTADAAAITELQRPASLQALLADVADSASALAYAELEEGGERIAQGTLPAGPGCSGRAGERELSVDGRPILDVCSVVPLGEGATGQLRLGLRLDAVRATERQLLLRLALSLLAAVAFTGLAAAILSLRHDHAALSRRHALAEEALRRRDRLLAMGELASTVAHEIRNPLNGIAMSAQRLRREFANPVESVEERAERDELLGVLVEETRRIDRIVRQFLDFARPPRLALAAHDLGALASSVVESLRPLAAARGVDLRCAAARAGTATLDADQMRQALGNVVRNAVEACPDGGHVNVTASSGGDGHALEVEDDGPGIPAEALPRIFDLYFTTKAEGTGVGLAVTHQVLTAHGGRVEVDSRPGAGTRLALRFPEAKA